MSRLEPFGPAKLLVGAFTADKDLFEPVVERLVDRLGPLDMVSPWIPFVETDYYRKEMGGPLFRRFAVFRDLVPQESLPDVKVVTAGLEARYADESGRRRVNLDPGLLTLERFVLATGKNFTHRIPLRDGVYADLTLVFAKGDFQTLPWTYPDYAGSAIQDFLRKVRVRLAAQRNRERFEVKDAPERLHPKKKPGPDNPA